MSTQEATCFLGLAFNTVCRLHHLFRTAIPSIAEDVVSLKAEIELDESHFGDRRTGKGGEMLQARHWSSGFRSEAAKIGLRLSSM